MDRPEYPTTDPSIEVWEEACVISQQWADGARQAARKRKRIHGAIGTTLVVFAIGVMVLLAFFLTGNL